MSAPPAMPAGTRLGPYQILEPIGAGGMGEVYKASDTRLDRVVAIKLLTKNWAGDSEMRQRFEREAQIVASLNHPNICVLHDVGQQDGKDFLVMEYLEGEDLAVRLERGPMPVDEALKTAIAIADALDKAHRRGVVHRDLKPSNVVLTAGGPKLLDFGLAKREGALTGRESARRSPSTPRPIIPSRTQLPTISNLTTAGAIMGTLQYMAPEQLEGLDADGRTDIFSFGALLYEMITGKKAFVGKSRILLMSAIATSQPEPLAVTQPAAPAALEHVVKTCLAKDPEDRWQTARDLLAELEWVAEAGSHAGARGGAARASAGAEGRREKLARILLAAAAVLVLVAALPAAMYVRGTRPAEEFRFHIPLSGSAQPYDRPGITANNSRSTAGTNFAVSPDGRTLAYVSRADNGEPWALWVRPLGSVTPQKLVAIEDAAPHMTQPFWSADSRFIGFVTGGELKKIETTGGPAQDICDAAGFFGGTWNRDNTILFGSAKGLFRVSAEGGKPEAVTTLGPGESGHYWPRFLPDGRRYLYTAWNAEAGKRAVVAGTLGSKETTRVLAAESNAAYAEPGFLLFHRGNAVYAQPFDWKKPALRGEPARVADEIGYIATNGWSDFAVSPGGVLVYFQTGSGAAAPSQENMTEWQLSWADRTARVLESPGPPGVYRGMEISPDGKRIAVHLHDASGGIVMVIEPRGSTTTLTFDASHHNSSPIWSPDGARIVYSALQKGKWGLYQTLSSGSGKEELLYESELLKAPMSWSPDGKRIVFWVLDPQNNGDLWVLPLEGDKKPEPLIASPFNETHAQISPDGKWIAYTSNSTGRPEVYVQPFPSGSGRYQISFHGGDWPRWRGDSKEIFYHGIAVNQDAPPLSNAFRGGALFSVEVTANGAAFEAGNPKPILRTVVVNYPHSGGDYTAYAVSADGKRFLTPQAANATNPNAGASDADGPDAPLSITVAMDWAAGLRR